MKEVTTRYVGLDVHKATITVAVADDGARPVVFGTIANDPGAVRKLVSQLKLGDKLVTAYEAGPTGYGLHRQLVELGVECVVVAPALIPRRAGNRVKTDSRDAVTLARLLRSGDLTRRNAGPSAPARSRDPARPWPGSGSRQPQLSQLG